MWIFLLGPFLSLLPERWRKALPFYQAVHWHSAAILSGLAESVIALGALMYWYSYSVTTWISRGLDNTLSKSAPTEITDHAIRLCRSAHLGHSPADMAHRLFGIEGTARTCAAFTDTVLGVFPLYLLDKMYSKIFRRGAPEPARNRKVFSGPPLFLRRHHEGKSFDGHSFASSR